MSQWEDEGRRRTGLAAAAVCLAALAVTAPAVAHGGGSGRNTSAPPAQAWGNPHAEGTTGDPHADGTRGNPHATAEHGKRHRNDSKGNPHHNGAKGNPHEDGEHGNPHAGASRPARAGDHGRSGPQHLSAPRVEQLEDESQDGQQEPQSHGAAHAKTTICHSTGSATNPYVEITISDRALAAHRRHHDGRDIIPAPDGGCPPAASAEQPSAERPDKEHGKTTICHSTGSATNPFVEITISDSALAAHRRHHDGRDIIPAPDGGCPGAASGVQAPPTAFTVPPVAPSLAPPGPPAVAPAGTAPTTSGEAGAPAAVAPAGTAAPVTSDAASPTASTAPVSPAGVAPAGTAAPATDASDAAPAGGVLGVSASGTEPASTPAVAAVRTARGASGPGLPFTGLTVAFIAAGGLGLLLAGAALRRAGTLRHR